MRWQERCAVAALYALLLWPAVAAGGYRGFMLAVTELVAVAGLLLWIVSMIGAGRLEWRRTALDLPAALLLALVLAQLAVSHRALVGWALGPAAGLDGASAALPATWLVGTVSPGQTARSLRLLATYLVSYVLVVNLVRRGRDLDRLLTVLVVLGGVLGFFGLLDHLAGEGWLLGWRPVSSPRLTGTFVNPDHFAAWLEMLICLGLGHVLSRSRPDPPEPWRARLGSREGRERLVRHYLPMIGVGVMALALLFTLSRGGVISLLAGLVALLTLQGARGHARRSMVLVGLLLAVTAGYGAWIGLGPLVDRFRHDAYAGRWIQLVSSLGILRDFPVLGVGLGAYRDIYARYQPRELMPGSVYFPFAHDDVLQFALETGVVGALVGLLAAWRVGADVIGAHLLGRGRCPVGGGEAEGARRTDRRSVGIGLGAVTAVVALLVHSAFDFAARIPANGVLAAACLGIATVALHTRLGGGTRLLTAVRVLPLPGARLPRLASSGAAVGLALVWAALVVRGPVVEWLVASASGPGALGTLDRAVALAPADPEARWARARFRAALARRLWESGQAPDGRSLDTWDERRREARLLLDGAIADARAAIAARPTDPHLHEALGWAHADSAVVDPDSGRAHTGSAIAALRRAIALQPGNPYLYRSLAVLAAGSREPLLPVALEAAREAVRREPALLDALVQRFLPLGLADARWAELVPDAPLDRLDLGSLLERAGLESAASDEYRRAAALSPRGPEAAVARVLLARLLLRRGDEAAALAIAEEGLRMGPGNPELELARASALAARGDPAALDAYRAALASAQRGESAAAGADPLAPGPRARAVVERALGPLGPPGVRYRRALALHLADRRLWDQALGEWDALLAALPGDAAAHHERARALEALGRRAEAVEEHRRAVALDDRSSALRLGLARSLWQSEQYFQAMNEWRGVLALDPGNLEAHRSLAEALVRAGDRDEARRLYERVLQLVPDDPQARRALARLGRGGAG